MTPERWHQVKELFRSALEHETRDRAAFLERACAGDDGLRREVESLLASFEESDSVIETTVAEAATQLLTSDQSESLVGQQLGHYETVALLGKGGMGAVYLARDTRLGRKVALKLLSPSFTKDDRLRRFELEACAASALNHPNILTIYEIGETSGTHFIATEFIEGETLRERMTGAPMKIVEVFSVAEQVASALAAAHEAGIIHRDIKPENVMVRRDALVKVLDFGLAKLVKQETTDTEATTRATVKTSSGVVMGTLPYMSPEQALGRDVDHRSDLFSLGVLLHEMATGQAPFAAANSGETLDRILHLQLAGPASAIRLHSPVESDGIRYVLHKIGQVASADVTVLIEGETGVGKELVARAIHKGSRRSAMPFIRVNCAALPGALIDTELFGHEKGSFTGADRSRQGRFELAEGGTLFLDEIAELPLEVQSKLLRVLQEGEYDRVGGTKTRKANVRLITATNRSLKKEVEAGRFREDLYFRVLGFPITVPPLRDRRTDIPALVEHFTQRLTRKHGRSITEIPNRLIRQLTECDWQGNVRELENVIERAVITSRGQTLSLPDDFSIPKVAVSSASDQMPLTLEEMERTHIQKVLLQTRGRVSGETGAAQLLGINPSTLRSRMAKLGIHKPA